LQRAAQAPAVALKLSPGRGVIDVRRQFKYFTSFFRRIDESKKLARLAPKVFLSAPRNIIQAARGPIGE